MRSRRDVRCAGEWVHCDYYGLEYFVTNMFVF
jgi:hypothetical protein